MSKKWKALVLPPASRLNEVCSEECRRLLLEHFNPVWNDTGRDFTMVELEDRIADAEILLTSWGSPVLTEEMLERAPRLRMIGHAAGTVKGRIPEAAFERGIRLFSAAPRIAQSVGEYCLAGLLASLRHIPFFDREVRSGNWKSSGRKGFELSGRTVGIVSASSTARAFIRLLAPFQVKVLVYDPYLSEEAARQLNVRAASLEEVMRCPIISVHAPKLPATRGMIDKRLIEMIPDHAVFINSSRADVLDEEALFAELSGGRFNAVLDVFSREPLAADSPFLQLDNVLLTPHVAGATVQGHGDLMQEVVQDMLRGLRQEKTRLEVTAGMWKTIA